MDEACLAYVLCRARWPGILATLPECQLRLIAGHNISKKGGIMTLLLRAWRSWKRFAQVIGDLSARAMLTVLYFTLVVPFGLGVRLSDVQSKSRLGWVSAWSSRTTHDRTMDDARRQF